MTELASRTDGRLLADLSRAELLSLLEAQNEPGIRIAFPGKGTARQLARRVRPRVSRLIAQHSVGAPEEQAKNLVIEGDNLQAMTTLYGQRGQVDLIITDPPYNTGNDWRYNDKWDEDPNDPGIGDWVGRDDPGRHTIWMRFMWPRLHMMRSMLKPAGVLAICIDHRELFRLGQMLDELFGENNRIAVINWERSSTLRNDKTGVSTATEYVLVYAKDAGKAQTGRVDRTKDQDLGYTNPDQDPQVHGTELRRLHPADLATNKCITRCRILSLANCTTQRERSIGQMESRLSEVCLRSGVLNMLKWILGTTARRHYCSKEPKIH